MPPRAILAWLALTPACADPGRPVGPDPAHPDEGWPEELRFPVACAETATEVDLAVGPADGAAFRVAQAVDSTCDRVAEAAGDALRHAVAGACADGGHPDAVCADLVLLVDGELARPYQRPGFASVTALPSEPDAEGTWADLELAFVDGTSERWVTGDKPWGRRYTWLGDDGGFAAQGSRVFERTRVGALSCRAERDHTAEGRYSGPSGFDVWWRETNTHTCGGDGLPAVDLVLTQRVHTVETP